LAHAAKRHDASHDSGHAPGASVTSTPAIAYVALGSNLGDREAHLVTAWRALAERPGTRVIAASRIYETDPVGPGPQGPYLNAVLSLETDLGALALLADLHAIERLTGRRREDEAERWGPRTLDLDLLLYGKARISVQGLEVPHPQLHVRPFVLEPLCELAGDLQHPTLGRSLSCWLEECRDPVAVRLWAAAANRWQVAGSAESS
jgi:2-amino-4-hydroxy-6-hydroxymethyldihydropteridine diphosphokinase